MFVAGALFSCGDDSGEEIYATEFYRMHYEKEMPLHIGNEAYDDAISVLADDESVGKISGVMTVRYWDTAGTHCIDNHVLIGDINNFWGDTITAEWFSIGKDAEGRLFVHVRENNSGEERRLSALVHAYSEKKESEESGRVPQIDFFELYQGTKPE